LLSLTNDLCADYIRKGDAALKAKLDSAIKDVARSGGFERITASYPDLKDVIATPKPQCGGSEIPFIIAVRIRGNF
jgi:hypothetical protein